MPSLEGTTCQCHTAARFHLLTLPNTSAQFGRKHCIALRALHSHGSDRDFSPTSVLSMHKTAFHDSQQNHSFLLEAVSVLAVDKLCAYHYNDCRNVTSFWHCMVPPDILLRELHQVAQEDNIIMSEILFAC